MIAVDTNILVYAHRADMHHHAKASEVVRSLAEGREPWAIPWPCIHEFYGIVTNPRIYREPTDGARATAQIGAWMGSPKLVLLAENRSYWPVLEQLLESANITGARVHDARIAAICLQHEVRQLLTADRDFNRFTALSTKNPLH